MGRRAFFPAGLFGGSMLFSSTLVVRYKVQIKQKLQRHNNAGVLGGRGWIRTTEAESSRFTVCPHWPLGNTPIFFCVRRADCLYILPRAKQFVNHLQQILSQFLHQSLQQTRPMEKPPGNQCSRAVFLGAGDRSRTCNPLITNQLRCHCATPAYFIVFRRAVCRLIMPSACDKSLVYRIAETTQIVNIHSCSRMGSVGQREHFFPVRSTVRFPGCAAAGMFRQAEPCRAGAGCGRSAPLAAFWPYQTDKIACKAGFAAL